MTAYVSEMLFLMIAVNVLEEQVVMLLTVIRIAQEPVSVKQWLMTAEFVMVEIKTKIVMVSVSG